MVTLLVAVTLATIFAIFATQNTGAVTLNFGNYLIPGVPVYLAVLVPLLSGLIFAWFFHMAKNLSQSMTINEKRDEIKRLKKELAEVTKSAHQFEIENIKFKSENGTPEDENSL